MFEYTTIPGPIVITPKVFSDERGYFFESYNQNTLKDAGITCDFVQDNQSYSEYGTLRGLHFQIGEHAQSKLVRVISGVVLDVCVDLRNNSPTFGKHLAVELSCQNQKQLFIPRGFAHGFLVLSKTATFSYKCDNFYNKSAERGLLYNDPSLEIDWRIPAEHIRINQRDMSFPILEHTDASIIC